MKKSVSLFLSASVLWILTFQTSCIGSFKLTKSYWDWNSGIGKWPGAALFFFLGGIITGATLIVDVVILNLIEFWTGSNPMSMNEGQIEKQVITGTDGNAYRVTATKNKFEIVQLSGSKAGEIQSMIYDPASKSWSHEKGCEVNKVLQYSQDGEFVSVFTNDGRMATIPAGLTDKEIASKMVLEQLQSQTCMN